MKAFLAAAAALAAFSAFAGPPRDTLSAERMAAHLKAAGLPDSDLYPFEGPDHPKEGGLVAVLPGKDSKLKAILLLEHIDVVEAKTDSLPCGAR